MVERRRARAVRPLRERATEHLGDLVPWVATLNEPNVITMLQLTGVIPMGVGERGPDAGPVEAAPAGVAGFDPARYQMGLMGAGRRADGRHPPGRRRCDQVRPRRRQGGLDARAGRPAGRRGRRGAPGGWPGRAPSSTGSTSRSDDDFVGVQTYSRNVLGPDRAEPVARRRARPCRPAGRCTPRRSATRCASRPSTPACR